MGESKIRGRVETEIGGEKVTLVFTWAALERLEAELDLESMNLMRPANLAKAAAAGLEKFHPDLTLDRLYEISPPVMPLVRDVERAFRFSYFGDGEVPDPEKEGAKKKIRGRVTGFLGSIASRIGRAFARRSSGG